MMVMYYASRLTRWWNVAETVAEVGGRKEEDRKKQ
jgi:hypothetical protein